MSLTLYYTYALYVDSEVRNLYIINAHVVHLWFCNLVTAVFIQPAGRKPKTYFCAMPFIAAVLWPHVCYIYQLPLIYYFITRITIVTYLLLHL